MLTAVHNTRTAACVALCRAEAGTHKADDEAIHLVAHDPEVRQVDAPAGHTRQEQLDGLHRTRVRLVLPSPSQQERPDIRCGQVDNDTCKPPGSTARLLCVWSVLRAVKGRRQATLLPMPCQLWSPHSGCAALPVPVSVQAPEECCCDRPPVEVYVAIVCQHLRVVATSLNSTRHSFAAAGCWCAPGGNQPPSSVEAVHLPAA